MKLDHQHCRAPALEYDLGYLIDCVCQRIFSGADELTTLDQAIGDADHGINMKRGFDAVLQEKDVITSQPLAQAMEMVGRILLMEIGGASGPLYSTFFLQLGRSLSDIPNTLNLAQAVEQAVGAVKKRGRTEVGQKTIVDVLGPVAWELNQLSTTLKSIRDIAAESADATVTMRAEKGRASYLGDRSVGHMDPGARSCQMIIETICDVLGKNA